MQKKSESITARLKDGTTVKVIFLGRKFRVEISIPTKNLKPAIHLRTKYFHMDLYCQNECTQNWKYLLFRNSAMYKAKSYLKSSEYAEPVRIKLKNDYYIGNIILFPEFYIPKVWADEC